MTRPKSNAAIERLRMRGGALVRVSGSIDETFTPEELSAGSYGVMVLDLDQVKQFTSFGIREWTNALRQLRADYYCFINCRPSFVSQLAMISDFTVAGEVVSFHAPYLCPECETEATVLLDLRRSEHREAVIELEPPPLSCPACGEESEFDDYPDLYFQYFLTASQPQPPALANAIIDGKESGQTLHISKHLTDQLTALWLAGNIDRPVYFRRLADGLQGDVVIELAEVDGFSPDGLAGFLAFLRSGGTAFYLARVPVRLCAALSERAAELGDARLVSVSLPCQCPVCDREVATAVDVAALADWDSGGPQLYCPDCAHALQPPATDGWLDAARRLPAAPEIPAIAEYLADHSSPASHAAPGRPGTGILANDLSGKYEIQERIGSGSMGDVYLARRVGPAGFKKQLVLKRILPERFKSKDAIEGFLREARLSARLSHPNIVQIFDLGRSGGEYFLTMEFVNGLDLRTAILISRTFGLPIPIAICCRIVIDLCEGLHAAHSHRDEAGDPSPIIHCDVSPANVLVSVDGVVKLTDFGIARSRDWMDDSDSGKVRGTRRFIPPELLGQFPPDVLHPRIDVYGAGLLLYECITGEALFSGTDKASTLEQITTKPIPHLCDVRPEVSPELARVFDRAVARDPDHRFQTILELRDQMQGIARDSRSAGSKRALAEWTSDMKERRQALGSKDLTP